MTWDLAVVGAGPAGAAAALAALRARPGLRVLLLDRADFPRDKVCGDGIAPHVLDVLSSVGVRDLLPDWTPVRELCLTHGKVAVARNMRRPAWVVPRSVFDARLVAAAVAAGAGQERHQVRSVSVTGEGVEIDGRLQAKVLVGADGAHSAVRTAAGAGPVSRRALALRGYAPTPPCRRGRQVMVFGQRRQPSYAWSFDRGDGLANVGYGELLDAGNGAPSRERMLAALEELLPGSVAEGHQWRAHHLPLSSSTFQQPDGPILLAGDAAGLVNPLTGEGIYYAVATGVLAGQAAVRALDDGRPQAAGALHRSAVRALLRRHLRHTALSSRLAVRPAVLRAGVAAAASDQHVFDALVELGLGRGRVTPRLLGGRIAACARPAVWHAQPTGG
jgi:menaquinone-9 beta-reductase